MFHPKMRRENLTPTEMKAAALQGSLELQKDLTRVIKCPQVQASYQNKLAKICSSKQTQQINEPLDKKSDWTPLMLAILYNNQLTDLNEKLGKPVYLFLIEQGADVNASNLFQMTPLMITAFAGDVTVARDLLQNGAQIDILNYHDETVAHLAFQEGKKELLQFLIDEGTDTSLRSYTKLCLQDEKTQKSLIEQGVSLRMKEKQSFPQGYKSLFDPKSPSY